MSDRVEIQRVNQGCHATLTASLVDEDGSALEPASVSTITVKLYNLDDPAEAIINSRDDTDVLSANGGSLAAGGAYTWQMAAADNPILDESRDIERHRAQFTITKTNGRIGIVPVEIHVRNLRKVSS